MRSVVVCTLLSGLIVGLCVRDISVTASQAGGQSSTGHRESGLIARVEALEKASIKPGMMVP